MASRALSGSKGSSSMPGGQGKGRKGGKTRLMGEREEREDEING